MESPEKDCVFSFDNVILSNFTHMGILPIVRYVLGNVWKWDTYRTARPSQDGNMGSGFGTKDFKTTTNHKGCLYRLVFFSSLSACLCPREEGTSTEDAKDVLLFFKCIGWISISKYSLKIIGIGSLP